MSPLLLLIIAVQSVFAQSIQITAVSNLYSYCSPGYGFTTDAILCTNCTPVVCDASNNVIEFNSLLVPGASSFSLAFSLSPYVGNLTHLQYFVLTGRKVNQSIPTEFGLLKNLSLLNLALNEITGTIPSELGDIPAMQQLSLFSNELSGIIPTELGRLSGLTFLSFALNRLTGPIPTEFGAFTNTSSLNLASNLLTGDVPTEIGLMTSLVSLLLNSNTLTGWPDELGNLTLLTSIDISSNALTGTVPSSFGRMASMNTLTANVNNLDGTLPTELGDLSQLTSLELFHNNLMGTIPTELGRCKQLYELRLHSNQLNGTIPTEFGGVNMSIMFLSYNQLSGTLPTELGSMPILSQLYIQNTLVDGPIPTQLGLLKKLSVAHLESNRLNGTIPVELSNATLLGTLDLSKNALTGSIPSSSTWRLTSLTLDQNDIVGPLPYFNSVSSFSCQYCKFTDGDVDKNTPVRGLDFTGNLFTRLPDFLFNGSTVVRAVLASNRISDTLEDKLFSTTLQTLRLGFNFLTGNPTLRAETAFSSSLSSQIDLQANRLNGQEIGLLQAATGALAFFDAGAQDVDECALGTHDCDHLCVDGWLPLYSFTCGCSNNTEPIYALGPDARTCYPCYLSTALDLESAASFTVLNQAQYASVRDQLPFASCSACNNGKRYVSQNFSTPECGLVVGSLTVGSCSFPCVGLKDIVGATEAIFILNQELTKDGFVDTLLNTLFNVTLLSINQSVPTRRREVLSVSDLDLGLQKRADMGEHQAAPTSGVAASVLGFTFSSSTNCSEITAITSLLASLAAEIVPRATLSFAADPSTCSMTTTASNPPPSNDQALALGIGLGVGLAFVLLLLLVVAFLLYQYFYQDPMMLLPKEVRWSFHQYKTKPYKWKYQGSEVSWYHYLRYEPGSWEWAKVVYLMSMLGGEDMLKSVTSITAIYNRHLTRAFVSQWMVMKERLRTQPEIFGKKLVRYAPEDVQNLQEFVYSKYYDLTRNFNWNDDNIVPILPAVHGTEEPIAEKIAQTGFANLSSLDAGYYGKGIYFTFSLPYAIPYIFAKRLPACIISYIIPGNIYAVTESHRIPEETLLGTALKQNAGSHFVLTDVNGHVITSREQKNYYTEICIGQEPQVVPAFIVTFDVADGRKMIEEWGTENGSSNAALGQRADLESSIKPLLDDHVVVDI